MSEIDSLSALEFMQWRTYDSVFPFGDIRDDWRMGTIASAIVNMANPKNKFEPQDFVLKPPKTQKQKDNELRDALRSAAKG